MWNRVFLLAAGFLFGWSLVRYWSVPRAQMATQALRLGVGLALGAAVVVLLGLESLPAAVAGVVVWALSALVAYAGNARQVNRVEDPPLAALPTPTGVGAPEQGVLLVSCLEPPVYDGPGYWVWRLRRREGRGEPAPHWFVRPRIYARIRSAYGAGAGGDAAGDSPPVDALQRIGQELGAALGADYEVRTARIAPTLASTRALADMARDGIPRIIVQPLHTPTDAMDEVRAAVTHSRVREVGVRVTLADPLPVPAWEGAERRLDEWMAGHRPEPLPTPDTAVVAELASRIATLAQ